MTAFLDEDDNDDDDDDKNGLILSKSAIISILLKDINVNEILQVIKNSQPSSPRAYL